MKADKHTKLCTLSFALALGILWGVSMLLAGWFAMFDWGLMYMKTSSSIYIGFEPTFWGGIVGGIWGFVHGFIFGGIFSWLYNYISCSKK